MKTLPNKKSAAKNYYKGFYLNKYKIVKIEDLSNKPGRNDIIIGSKGFAPDICLNVTFESDKYRYERYLFGNYLYQKDSVTGDKVVGWDTKRNAVYDFICELYDSDVKLTDDYLVHPEILDSLIGKEVWMIRYNNITGMSSFFWAILEATDGNKQLILDLFEKYKPKDYAIPIKEEKKKENKQDDEPPF
jgi:hypothetical protein